MEQIKDAVFLEQFLNCLSSPKRVGIKERKPKSYLEAGQLADDYTEARKQVEEEKITIRRGSRVQHHHKRKVSHQGEVVRRDAVAMVRSLGVRMWCVSGVGSRAILHPSVQTRQTKCPNKAMFCGTKRESNPSLQRRGVVEGKYVQDILLDTGCSKTLLVHQKLVPEGKVLPGETTLHTRGHGALPSG